MYRTSGDRRFQKNKKAIRKAFISLVISKGYRSVTISDISAEADINRMTFYAHYDTVEDVFNEFVEDMEQEIASAVLAEPDFDMDRFFNLLNSMMYKEIEFFRYVAKEKSCSDFRSSFQKAINKILQIDFAGRTDYPPQEKLIAADLVSVCIAGAYLNWLAGDYGSTGLDTVIAVTKNMLKDQMVHITYREI